MLSIVRGEARIPEAGRRQSLAKSQKTIHDDRGGSETKEYPNVGHSRWSAIIDKTRVSHGHLSLRLLEAYKEMISRLISSSFVRVTLDKTLFQLFLNNSQPSNKMGICELADVIV
jgi:hypothetical protein